MSIDQEKLQLAKKVLDVLLKTERKDGFYDHMNMDNWEWPVGVAQIGRASCRERV